MQKTVYREPRSDAGKPLETAQRLGQVFTPDNVANIMISDLTTLAEIGPQTTILDPCIGEAALPKALVRSGNRRFRLYSYELDPRLADISDGWIVQTLSGTDTVVLGDFLTSGLAIGEGFDIAIANPPYIRQEWIEDKKTYQSIAADEWGVLVPGTSNLYVYFIVKMLLVLRPGGAFSVLIYDSWAHTKYGRWLVEFMNERCESVRSTPIKGAPFEGRLIDATVISGRRKNGENGEPNQWNLPERGLFEEIDGFVPISSEYWTKRGLRLKQAAFFMGDEKDIALHGATRFAKKPAKVTGLCIRKHHPESALLLPLQGHQDPRVLDELDHRLRVAKESPEANQSILNWFQNRPEYWSRHPEPPQAPILFNYYFRARPKHFLSPLSIPYADNYYGVAPENGMSPIAVFALLNSTAVCLELEANSRTQGSGLHKLQLFEYRQAYVPARKMFCSADLRALEEHGERLSQSRSRDLVAISEIDETVYCASGYCDALDPAQLEERANTIWDQE